MPTTQLANINNSINRKIFLYEIRCRQKGIEGDQEFHYIQQLFQEIQQRGNTLEYNNPIDNRWYAVESITPQNNLINGISVCCKYKYRPNLINIQNKTERVSPKAGPYPQKNTIYCVFWADYSNILRLMAAKCVIGIKIGIIFRI